jgi:hypothetical protein
VSADHWIMQSAVSARTFTNAGCEWLRDSRAWATGVLSRAGNWGVGPAEHTFVRPRRSPASQRAIHKYCRVTARASQGIARGCGSAHVAVLACHWYDAVEGSWWGAWEAAGAHTQPRGPGCSFSTSKAMQLRQVRPLLALGTHGRARFQRRAGPHRQGSRHPWACSASTNIGDEYQRYSVSSGWRWRSWPDTLSRPESMQYGCGRPGWPEHRWAGPHGEWHR